MTSARERCESEIRLALIYHADQYTSGYLLSEVQIAAIMAAADRYRAAGQPAVTAPARGGSRAPATSAGGRGIPGPPQPEARLVPLGAERDEIVAAIVAGLVEGS